VSLNDLERLPGVGGTHMVILPEGRRGILITEPNQHLTAARAFNVNVRRLVLPRRRVHVDSKRAILEQFDHDLKLKPNGGIRKSCRHGRWVQDCCLTNVCSRRACENSVLAPVNGTAGCGRIALGWARS
jgi:hypothetical protein